MELGKSLEDYLEAILILTNKNGSVRSVDLLCMMQSRARYLDELKRSEGRSTVAAAAYRSRRKAPERVGRHGSPLHEKKAASSIRKLSCQLTPNSVHGFQCHQKPSREKYALVIPNPAFLPSWGFFILLIKKSLTIYFRVQTPLFSSKILDRTE